MRNVMIRAWEIAREGAEKFGGKAVEYIAAALKMAWAEIKKGANKMLNVIKERAKEFEAEFANEGKMAKHWAMQKAKVEYIDLVKAMREINEATGKETVKIDKIIERLETATLKDYDALIMKINHYHRLVTNK